MDPQDCYIHPNPRIRIAIAEWLSRSCQILASYLPGRLVLSEAVLVLVLVIGLEPEKTQELIAD